MASLLRVLWTLSPCEDTNPATLYPQALRHCRRCSTVTPHPCSGRFRVNAQKKRLDVWLIYRCVACGNTWNRPIHERTTRAAIGDGVLARLMADDPAELARHAGDVAGLSRHCDATIPAAPSLRKVALAPAQCEISATAAVDIVMCAPPGTARRLDQVLAEGLALSRRRIMELYREGAITIDDGSVRVLRRPVRDGQRIRIALNNCLPAEAVDIAAHCR